MTTEQMEAIKKELKWESHWYQRNRDTGFDEQADRNWNTIKGMQKALWLMGFDTECNPETLEWTITAMEA